MYSEVEVTFCSKDKGEKNEYSMERFCDKLNLISQITNDLYGIRFWSWLTKNERWIASNDGWAVPKIKLN